LQAVAHSFCISLSDIARSFLSFSWKMLARSFFKPPAIQVQKTSISDTIQDSLIQWIVQWVNPRPISFDVKSKHFFLEGMRLEEFTRGVIG
jgi:hypothetical protein